MPDSYISLSLLGFIHSREIHVSKLGKDHEHCATINNPCQTIHYAFYNVSSSNDIIKIDGSVHNFTIKHQILISKPMNITFTSYNGVAWIYGDDASWRVFKYKQFLVVENYKAFQMSTITFKKINFRDTALAKLGDKYDVLKIERKVILKVTKCIFEFSNFELKGRFKRDLWVMQAIISVRMPFTEIEVKNCVIQANHKTGVVIYVDTKGCLDLSSSKIIFADTRIENARYSLQSPLSICRSALTRKDFRLSIVRCLVKSNGKSPSRKPQLGIAFGRVYKHMTRMTGRVVNSRFEGFYVTTKMAAVMDIRGPTRLFIINCTFKGNIGNRGGALSFDLATVTIADSHFDGNKARLSTICANKDEGGNGGAIFVSGYGGPRRFNIYRTSFVNNTATCFGSAVYIGYYVSIKMRSIRFSTSAASRLSSETVWFSYSQQLSIKNVTLEVRRQIRMIGTIFLARYKGKRMRGKTLSFRCPNGSAVNIASKYVRVSRERAIEVKCHHCPKETYTLKPNHVSTIDDTDLNQTKFQTKCQSCSFGAVCKRGIRPKPNFWGHVFKDMAVMFICPPGYCCQSKSRCVSLHSCNGMRTGRLCGKCKKGYFQSIFTSDCIHEKLCKPGKFWALAVCSCLLFTILFIFLQDIFLIIVRLLSMKKILDSIKRKFKCLWDTLSCMKKGRNEVETIRDDIEQDTELMHNEPVNNADGNVDQISNSHLDDCTPKSDNDSMAGGLIKIIFFFYQVHSLLTIYKSNKQTLYLTEIKGFVLSIFNLNLHFAVGSEIHCPFHEMDSTTKVLITASFPISCLVFTGVLCALAHAVPSCFRKKDIIHRYAMKAKPKLLIAILQFILLGYATLTSSILSLVTCLPLADGQKILYVDGNISCYQHWQYGILSFVLLWAIPLIYALHKLPTYIGNREISIQTVYVALLLPFPFFVYTMVRSARKMRCRKESAKEQGRTSGKTDNDNTMSLLLTAMSGPFRYNESSEHGAKVSWEPVLLLQRILLSLCHTFILEPGKRSLVLLLFIMIMANLNFMYRPFNNRFLNATNGVTFILLCITGIINAIYAFIYEYGAVPIGPLVQLLNFFDYVEVTITLSFPIIAVVSVTILVITKLVAVIGAIVHCIVTTCRNYWSRES